MSPASRGFRHLHRAPAGQEDWLPPGQYLTDGFPVLSAGPTPHTPLEQWTFLITQEGQTKKSWPWEEFQALPAETITPDIHCVTRWSKLDTMWRGVSVDTLLGQVEHDAGYVLAFCDGGPLESEHGGPARLLVPHLYFWKSAKWVCGWDLRDHDEPGFWEINGYHMYGDPWKEQRYAGD